MLVLRRWNFDHRLESWFCNVHEAWCPCDLQQKVASSSSCYLRGSHSKYLTPRPVAVHDVEAGMLKTWNSECEGCHGTATVFSLVASVSKTHRPSIPWAMSALFLQICQFIQCKALYTDREKKSHWRGLCARHL